MRVIVFFIVLMFSSGIGAVAAESCETGVSEVWYSECRELYYSLPVLVEFYPADAGLSQRVWTYLEEVDDIFNDYKPGSEISRINALNTTNEVVLSPMLAEAFELSRRAYVFSDGAFDISCAPIRNLWKRGGLEHREPTDEEVAGIFHRCGLKHAHLTGSRLSYDEPGMQFDFGGIMKGIIADHVCGLLEEGGATSALVQVGGETMAYGSSNKGRPFRVAIQHPQYRDGTWCVVQSPSGRLSASTSGNYENPVIINGEVFYHIFDVRTGRPAKTRVASVSIVFPEEGMNWMADSLSTTGVLLGPEKTMEIVEQLGGEALFLVWNGDELQEIASKGWSRFQL